MNRVLENGKLRVTVSDAGAELVSVWDKEREVERIWRGDVAVWGRHAPVLFPFVGKVAGGRYTYRGQEYKMTSHGFARDREFELVDADESSVTHVLRWNEESLKIYPFKFALYVKHSFDEKNPCRIKIEWKVVNEENIENRESIENQDSIENQGNTENIENNGSAMLYGIGGHPAFTYPKGVSATDCSLKMEGSSLGKSLEYHLLDGDGCIDMSKKYELELEDGRAVVEEHMFDKDALIVLGKQVEKIELCDNEGRAYVCMSCEGFPYFGIWSKKVDEFVCLEPWYGIADTAGHDGDIEKKPGMQRLDAGESRSYAYMVDF